MAHAMQNLAGKHDAAIFLARRIWRVAPLLYCLTVVHLIFQSLLGGRFDAAQIINCFTILPFMDTAQQYKYALIPVWTLGYELAFYIVMGTIVAWGLSAQWAFVPLLLMTLLPGDGPTGSPLMLEFLFGIAAFLLWSRGLAGGSRWWLIAASFTLALPIDDARAFAWGIPAALIIMSALGWQSSSGPVARAGSWLGTISYSLYLSHVVTFDAVAPAVAAVSPLALWGLLPILGLVVAWLVFEAIEAPLWNYGNRIIGARTALGAKRQDRQ